MLGRLVRQARRLRPLPVALAILALAPLARAGQMIVNGVPIANVDLTVDGLKGVEFDKCTAVKIDAAGNVNVECPGYDLQAAGAQAQPATPAPATAPATATTLPSAVPAVATAVPGQLTRHYWLVTEQAQPGGTQYDIDLYINSKWVRRFKNDDTQLVFEVTKDLVPGKNKILFSATKNLAGGRKESSPGIFYRVVIGEGDVGGGNVMISNPLVDWRVTAAQTNPTIVEERDITAR